MSAREAKAAAEAAARTYSKAQVATVKTLGSIRRAAATPATARAMAVETRALAKVFPQEARVVAKDLREDAKHMTSIQARRKRQAPPARLVAAPPPTAVVARAAAKNPVPVSMADIKKFFGVTIPKPAVAAMTPEAFFGGAKAAAAAEPFSSSSSSAPKAAAPVAAAAGAEPVMQRVPKYIFRRNLDVLKAIFKGKEVPGPYRRLRADISHAFKMVPMPDEHATFGPSGLRMKKNTLAALINGLEDIYKQYKKETSTMPPTPRPLNNMTWFDASKTGQAQGNEWFRYSGMAPNTAGHYFNIYVNKEGDDYAGGAWGDGYFYGFSEEEYLG